MLKKNYLIAFFVLAICFGAASQYRISAQIAGGYGDASTNSKEIRRAARFAVKQRAKAVGHAVTLLSIQKAETQVVAGLNYRVCMRVRDGKRVRTVTAVVYRNLKNQLSLSRWRAGGCSDL